MYRLKITNNENGEDLINTPLIEIEENKYIGIHDKNVFECYPVRNELFIFYYDSTSYFKKICVNKDDGFLLYSSNQETNKCNGTVSIDELSFSQNIRNDILEKYNKIRRDCKFISTIDAGIQNSLLSEELCYNLLSAELSLNEDEDVKVRKQNN